MPDLIGWMREHGVLMTWLGALSVFTFLLGVVLVPVVIARLPADHFVRSGPRPDSWRDRHPAVRLSLRVVRNLLGVLLVLAGIAMLVLPGQGILTILLGLALVDLPGKRRVEVAILRRAPVRKAIDWLRRRAGKPPLLLPQGPEPEPQEPPRARSS